MILVCLQEFNSIGITDPFHHIRCWTHAIVLTPKSRRSSPETQKKTPEHMWTHAYIYTLKREEHLCFLVSGTTDDVFWCTAKQLILLVTCKTNSKRVAKQGHDDVIFSPPQQSRRHPMSTDSAIAITTPIYDSTEKQERRCMNTCTQPVHWRAQPTRIELLFIFS
jgi:hypothetical protein